MAPMFSIIVVTLNPGEKLIETIKSIRMQSYTDYQVVVKDGGSKDNCLEQLRKYLQTDAEMAQRVKIVEKPDKSIYEGMNQATQETDGDYLYFLNCGDTFAHEQALQQMAEGIMTHKSAGGRGLIFYGNIYDALRKQIVPSNPHMDDFACYRHVPNHQACIYHKSLFAERGYQPEFKVRGDYEHFLWSYFCKDANPQYVDVTLASYEGGGFSETKENRVRSAREHQIITRMYMSKGQLLRYKMILLLTLAPLRTKMAESPVFAGLYMKIKKLLYRQ